MTSKIFFSWVIYEATFLDSTSLFRMQVGSIHGPPPTQRHRIWIQSSSWFLWRWWCWSSAWLSWGFSSAEDWKSRLESKVSPTGSDLHKIHWTVSHFIVRHSHKLKPFRLPKMYVCFKDLFQMTVTVKIIILYMCILFSEFQKDPYLDSPSEEKVPM